MLQFITTGLLAKYVSSLADSVPPAENSGSAGTKLDGGSSGDFGLGRRVVARARAHVHIAATDGPGTAVAVLVRARALEQALLPKCQRAGRALVRRLHPFVPSQLVTSGMGSSHERQQCHHDAHGHHGSRRPADVHSASPLLHCGCHRRRHRKLTHVNSN